MALSPEQIQDLVITTLQTFGRPSFGCIAQDMPDYVMMNQMLEAGSVKLSASQDLEHTLMVQQSKNARNVGLYADDAFAVQDNIKKINVYWRHTTNNFIYDIMEKAFNGTPEQIVDLIWTRRLDMLLGLAEHMELAFWGKPSSSADDETPWGIQYWLKLATSGAGFNGGDITGFTAGPGGLASDTYTKWKHYNAVYSAFADDDLSKEMRSAYRACNFKSPVSSAGKDDAASMARYKILSGEAVQEGLIKIARAQNDNIGTDLAAYDGGVTFKRLPIQYVPSIDQTWTSTEYPVFMLDTAHLKVCMHSAQNFRETGPDPVPGKHTVKAVFTDVTWNVMCTDRRRQAVINRV